MSGSLRIGFGYDVHRLVEGRPLILGGVRFDHPFGLEGHSDADVLLHAIADGLLGAAALGDIGVHFPPGEPEWKGAESTVILAKTRDLVLSSGYAIVNTDATVVAERPRIMPRVGEMRSRTAEAMGIPVERVSIKATTTEGLGFTGSREGIAAYAVVLLESK